MIAQIIQNIGWIVFIGGLTTLLFTITYAVKRRKGVPSTTATPPPVPGTAGGAPVQSNGSGCLGWIIVGVIAVVLISLVSANPKYVNVAKAKFRQIINMETTEEWEFTWELPQGETVRSLNKSGPFVAEVSKRNGNYLWVDIHYVEYNRAEKTNLRLLKIGDKSWEGPWSQDNPRDFGRCDLHEGSNGELTGSITGTSGKRAFCSLRRK